MSHSKMLATRRKRQKNRKVMAREAKRAEKRPSKRAGAQVSNAPRSKAAEDQKTGG